MRRDARGFTLLELIIGFVILTFILAGIVLSSKTSAKGNRLGRDLSDGTSKLSSLVDSLRSVDATTLTNNVEQTIATATDTLRWILYDNVAPAPYTQSAAGIYLLNAKYSWKKFGIVHQITTATMLMDPL